MSDDPILQATCGFNRSHEVPAEDVRVMKCGAGDFVVACDCSEEPLSETHERPHPTEMHLGTILGTVPSPADWLALDDLADGWYDESPHEPIEDDNYDGTPAQHRAKMREEVAKLAKKRSSAKRGGATDDDEKARGVACPDCGVNAGRKCKRPSGHHVRKSHADRIKKARAEGLLDEDSEDSEGSGQMELGQFWERNLDTAEAE